MVLNATSMVVDEGTKALDFHSKKIENETK
jgi:hypothetical protein